MVFTDAQLTAWIGHWLWPLVRIGGLLAVAPVLGAKNVPARARVVLALLMTLVMAPLVGTMPVYALMTPPWFLEIARQLVIGIAMGFVLMLVFEAITFGGEMIAYGMGLSFAQLVDPVRGASTPVVGQLLLIFATLIFLANGAHLRLIEALAMSFQTLPVGGEGLTQDAFLGLARWGGELFIGGLRLALPLVIALLLVNLAFGVMGRAAPSLGGMAVGFPIALAAGMVLLRYGLPTFADAVNTLFEQGFGRLAELIGASRG